MDGDSVAKARILVVDDSRLMRKAANKMLGEEFDVITAEDGEQAWTLLGEDATIQVVFTDLNMPNVDGYELLTRVRASDDASIAALPVIVVTGAENDEAARMSALDMGATDFITKPFTTVDLLARARAHANNQRITRRLQAQSTLDALTGLGNLAGFLDRLQQDISYARRHQTALCVVRLDIVDFRRLFLYHGRAVAESLVLQVARLVRARIRKEDTAGRVGLGGFALSLPAGDASGIEGMIGRLRDDLLAQPPVDEEGLPITVAIASAVIDADLADATTAKSLLALCEARLAGPHIEIAQVTAAPVVAAPPTTAQAVVEPVDVPPPHVVAVPEVAGPEPDVASPAATVPAPPVPEAATAPAPAPAPSPATATATARVEAIRLDPLLDHMAAGDTRPLAEKLPQVIGRLLPVFRLLGPNQRAQLIQFLQRLG